MKHLKVWFVLFGLVVGGLATAMEEDPIVGRWEIERPESQLRYYSGARYASYSYGTLPTVLSVEKALSTEHDYLVRWETFSSSLSPNPVFTFWCDGENFRFQCNDRAGANSFNLEFLTIESAEVQDLKLGYNKSGWAFNYSTTQGLLKSGAKWLKIPSDLHEDLKRHASDEKKTVEEWAVRTLRGFSDLMSLPGAKGHRATFIIDQSRNYYQDQNIKKD